MVFFLAGAGCVTCILPGVEVGGKISSWLDAKGADLKNCSRPGNSSSTAPGSGDSGTNCAGIGSMSRSSMFESTVALLLILSLTDRRALNMDKSSGSNCFFLVSVGSASLTTN